MAKKDTVKGGGAAKKAKGIELKARLADGVRNAAVTGDFTSWSEAGIPLAKQADGVWAARLDLAPGRYEYRLRVDGEWRDHAEAAARVPNPFGGENCVLTVQG